MRLWSPRCIAARVLDASAMRPSHPQLVFSRRRDVLSQGNATLGKYFCARRIPIQDVSSQYRDNADPKHPPPRRGFAPKAGCLDQDLFLPPNTAIEAVFIAVEQAAHLTSGFCAPHHEYEASLEELT